MEALCLRTLVHTLQQIKKKVTIRETQMLSSKAINGMQHSSSCATAWPRSKFGAKGDFSSSVLISHQQLAFIRQSHVQSTFSNERHHGNHQPMKSFCFFKAMESTFLLPTRLFYKRIPKKFKAYTTYFLIIKNYFTTFYGSPLFHQFPPLCYILVLYFILTLIIEHAFVCHGLSWWLSQMVKNWSAFWETQLGRSSGSGRSSGKWNG